MLHQIEVVTGPRLREGMSIVLSGCGELDGNWHVPISFPIRVKVAHTNTGALLVRGKRSSMGWRKHVRRTKAAV